GANHAPPGAVALPHGGEGDGPQRFAVLSARTVDAVSREVELTALGVEDEIHPAMQTRRLRLLRQTLDGAHAKKSHAPREFPALRDCDGGTDASVGTGTEANCDAIDRFTLDPRCLERTVNQRQCTRLTGGGS